MSFAPRRFVLTGAFVLACLASSPATADPMRVVLKDGSVVIGELVAVQSGRLVSRVEEVVPAGKPRL